ncbi:hypothetical protein [Sphingomonas yabuuchiae]|uniref:Uncharacterized protein n=1 Tax=Sphingomonas yabuuchiae TaxID=172044 RepID=A0AA41DBD6_9SPHN|nr:hypothetical protein [Sphingomonas yabuuchiae]MBB4610766.1 hypothetical protein [Sphingomonas yabuuchiae]MBN3557681.1 hypothetical protein [Sphingomonas yabuuchiae]
MTRRRSCRRTIDDPFDGVRTPQQRGVRETPSGRPIVGARELLVEAVEMMLATEVLDQMRFVPPLHPGRRLRPRLVEGVAVAQGVVGLGHVAAPLH